MPRLARRLAAIAAGLLLAPAIALAGCAERGSTMGPDSEPTGAVAAAVVHRADLAYGGAQIEDDLRAGSLTVRPRRANGALVVFLHGWGQTRWALLERPSESGVARALTAAGFTVLAVDARLKAWGDPASVATYRSLIERTAARYRLRDVFLMGESMGGLATMQLAGQLPRVRAVTAWYPVCDLRTMRQARFRASITSAWRGLDRDAVSPVAPSDKPMLVWASAADTVVPAATNAAVCVARARAAGARVTWFHTSGQHGDPSNFVPSAVVEFFEQHRTPVV